MEPLTVIYVVGLDTYTNCGSRSRVGRCELIRLQYSIGNLSVE